MSEPSAILDALKQPFDPRHLKWKAQSVKNSRALAVAYIDARAVQERLDRVVGAHNWQDRYEVLPSGAVVCTLSLRIAGEWIAKSDVGSESEQPDEGDRHKAAFSDALKRAAVKFGVGRYLYRLPTVWVDYDPQKKQLVKTPPLPAWALPKGSESAPTPPPAKAPSAPRQEAAPSLPRDGKDLVDKLHRREAELVEKGLCRPGELLEAVHRAGKPLKHPEDLAAWAGQEQMRVATDAARTFVAHIGSAPSPGQLAALDTLIEQCGRTLPRGWKTLRQLPAVADKGLDLPATLDEITRRQYEVLLPMLEDTVRSDRQPAPAGARA